MNLLNNSKTTARYNFCPKTVNIAVIVHNYHKYLMFSRDYDEKSVKCAAKRNFTLVAVSS